MSQENKKEINVPKMEHLFQIFLQEMGIKKEDLSDDQFESVRTTFMAGAGAMLITFTTVIPEMEDDDAVIAIEGLIHELEGYADRQIKES